MFHVNKKNNNKMKERIYVSKNNIFIKVCRMQVIKKYKTQAFSSFKMNDYLLI